MWLQFVRSFATVTMKNVADYSAMCFDCHDLFLCHEMIYPCLVNSTMSASIHFVVLKLLLIFVKCSDHTGEKEKVMGEMECNKKSK